MSDAIRINLGCGNKRLRDHIGVDAVPGEAVDIVADITTWEPIFNGECRVQSVVASHVLEHLAKSDAESLVRRIATWLVENGTLIVEMPCRAKCLKLATENEIERVEWSDRCIQGLGGLLGDRPAKHAEWVAYIADLRDDIVANANECWFIDPSFNTQYEPHVYVWETQEFATLMRRHFRSVFIERPQFHGRRDYRDMRVVGKFPMRPA